MDEVTRLSRLLSALRRRPEARAVLSGSPEFPELHGIARFYQTAGGVLVSVAVTGLPSETEACGFFGMHIHQGSACTGNETDPFANVQAHYNPGQCPHPAHAGDLPPLLADRGQALLLTLTSRFRVREIIGRTILIHAMPDDFTTQPAGNSGMKIACGEIQALPRRR